MHRFCRTVLVVGILLVPTFLAPTPASADIKFTRLDEDQFVVYHRKLTLLGAEAKAMNTLYKETASICIAAGYAYFEIREQQVGQRQHGGAWGGGRGASGSVRVKLHQEDGEDFIACQPLADPKKVERAKKKLAAGS